MPDWTRAMTQTYEYYRVDPVTWKDVKAIDTITSSSIERDISADTLGSASFESTEDLGECYIRVYLVTIQDGIKEKTALGTFIVQTPSYSFDGMKKSISMDAYSPLIELKEKKPPIGYSLIKDQNIMDAAYQIVRENVRANVISSDSDEKLYSNFVSNTDESWMDFISELIQKANYAFDINAYGEIMFSPYQTVEALSPVWTYTDDENSIFLPDISVDRDLYGIPNVVEVIWTQGGANYVTRVTNDDPSNPLSIQRRGREIVQRVVNPSFSGNPSDEQLREYALRTLEQASTLTVSLSYSHGYCPVRVGDGVYINYERAGLKDVKAKVTKQSIECKTGCTVDETAVYTMKAWEIPL